MTTIASTPSTATVTSQTAATPTDDSVKLGFRRGVQVALPGVAGVLLAAAVATDPGASNTGREMFQVYAAHLDRLQWHVLTLHLAFGIWGLIPIALAPLVRGRGRRLMNAAAVLGFLVMVSMPAMMLSDMFIAAVVNQHGIDAAMRMYDTMPGEQWALKSYLVPGLASMVLCLPLAFAALARARRTPWWAVVPAALVLPSFAAFGAAGIGVVVTSGLLVGLSVLVFRATRA